MKKLAIRFGLWMFAGFVTFFLVIHVLSLSNNYNLRVLNGIIHLGIIYLSIKAFRSKYPDTVSNYVSGTAMGIYASAIGVLGFAIFMILFLYFDSGFLQELREAMPMGDYLTPITASLFILMESIAVSLIGSYILTRVVDMNLART